MLVDLGLERILFLRDVAGLLEQGQIDVGLDIALRAGVAVPIPSAAEIAGLLYDAEVADALLLQPRCDQHAAETAAENGYVDVRPYRLTHDLAADVGVFFEV